MAIISPIAVILIGNKPCQQQILSVIMLLIFNLLENQKPCQVTIAQAVSSSESEK
jgi:hypothetical protein